MITNELLKIYEPLFYPCAYRDPQKALQAIMKMVKNKKGYYIFYGEVQQLFHYMDPKQLQAMIVQNIKDVTIIKEIANLLDKEKDLFCDEYDCKKKSVPAISWFLADIYLHHIIDAWYEEELKDHCKGDCGMIRFRNEVECCFEQKEDIMQFISKLLERLQLFGLQLDAQQSILIQQD